MKKEDLRTNLIIFKEKRNKKLKNLSLKDLYSIKNVIKIIFTLENKKSLNVSMKC